MEFDPVSGFVFSTTLVANEGAYRHDRLQFGPREISGGFQLPTFSAEVTFQGASSDELHMGLCKVFFVEEARLNAPIADGAFEVAVPSGAHVVDHTVDTPRPAINRVTADASSLEDLAESLRQPAKNKETVRIAGWVYGVAAAAAIGLLALCWRFRRRRG